MLKLEDIKWWRQRWSCECVCQTNPEQLWRQWRWRVDDDDDDDDDDNVEVVSVCVKQILNNCGDAASVTKSKVAGNPQNQDRIKLIGWRL